MTPFVDLATRIFSALTVVVDLVVLIIVFVLLTRKFSWSAKTLIFFKDQFLLLSFLVALGATLGSLFYSEVAGFAPCVLCWWQRVFLYPQVLVLGFGLWKKSERVWNYVLGLSVVGGLIAAYNTYLQFGGFSVVPCAAIGPSCAERYFLDFGYVTIPTMSLTVFLLLIVLSLAGKVKIKTETGGSELSK